MAPIFSIIAMKGHPFTRKTEFATKIAASLQCPMLSYEDFLGELHLPLSPEREKEVFPIIRMMAYHHLCDGISANVVIDSRLSSAWHLERLTEMAEYITFGELRIIIIECKPSNAYSWRLKFEKYMSRFSPSQLERIPWYKTKRWEDVEKAIQNNPDYDEKSIQDHYLVSKLVVDPVILGSFEERIPEAVKYMMTRNKEDDSDHVVHFRQWKQIKSSSITDCNSKYGHIIVTKSMAEEGLQHKGDVDCVFCEKQIMMSDDDAYCYYCKGCNLALHKECAESSAPKRIEYIDFACRPCKELGEDMFPKCVTCAVQTNLRGRRLPTVIRHVDTEEHFLIDRGLTNTFDVEDYCVVCGKDYGEWSMYFCNICGLGYHYGCLNLPRQVNHEHGLHYHHLSLKYTSEEAEDYLCNECNGFRDPSLWFYSCEECPYELHPSCVRKDKVYRSDSFIIDDDFDWEKFSHNTRSRC